MCNKCRCDEGYDMPELRIHYHEVKAEDATVADKDGQQRLFRDAALGVVAAAREKRDSLKLRVAAMKKILDDDQDSHYLLWHDLDAERDAIKKAVLDAVTVTGNQDLEEREKAIIGFSQGKFKYLSTKPSLAGSGCNFQYHCSKAVFVGIGFKFAEFIQGVHRIFRYLQKHPVDVHIIYCESERLVLKNLLDKWERHKAQVAHMTKIIKEYGLSELALAQALTRSIGVERVEIRGDNYQLVNNDSILEARNIATETVGLILTSIPFSSQYEYTPSLNDMGHSEDNKSFFDQMDYLTPELYRALIPGRVAAIHVKDRTVPGGMTGLSFQSAYPFHCDTIYHFMQHGFVYMGMKTITTDVVRENNQTYRLGWTEQCKDGTKMGYGMPEYLLLFRKPQTDRTKGYGDFPVRKDKTRYSKARWQADAHAFTRSNGNRHLAPDELINVPHQKIFGMFHDFYLQEVYDFEHHVKLGEALEAKGRLPVTFMLLQPPSVHPDVWTDITRMVTANALQAKAGRVKHLCPMQFDIADRVIIQMSNPGDLILDPFVGIGTVATRAIALGRKAIGIELNTGYIQDAALYCKAAEEKRGMPTLFDLYNEPDTILDTEGSVTAAQETLAAIEEWEENGTIRQKTPPPLLGPIDPGDAMRDAIRNEKPLREKKPRKKKV